MLHDQFRGGGGPKTEIELIGQHPGRNGGGGSNPASDLLCYMWCCCSRCVTADLSNPLEKLKIP